MQQSNIIVSEKENDDLEKNEQFKKVKLGKEEKRLQANKFNLTSNAFMSLALEDIPSCQELIRIILDREDIVVDEVKCQYAIPNARYHSVVLDVYAHDSLDNRYSIEIQNDNRKNDVKRVRYIQGSVDTYTLKKGQDYSELSVLYIIFITDYDFIGGGKAIYHVERIVKETGLPLDNDVHEIYLNLKNISDNSSLRELQEYFLNSEPNHKGNVIKELAKRVTYLKTDEGGIEKVCAICDEIREEGKAEGIKEGIKANVLMCKNLELSMSKAIQELQKAYNMPEDEASKYVEMYW